MNNIAAVSFKIDDSHVAHIFPSGTDYSKYPESDGEGLLHFRLSEELLSKEYFEYKSSDLNINSLRLKETIRYCCVVDKCISEVYPHINNQDNKLLKLEQEKDRIIFQFINYLGKSFIYFGNDKSRRIEFEVVPDKFDYETDYVELTKAIAEECSSLLLDYTSPTSLTFQQDEKKESTVLEQFIFLRTFCYSENIESLFSSIKRNPDRLLEKEDELKPFGMGAPSAKFFSNSFSNSRGWLRTGNGSFLPSEISVVRKYDSFDTPANRFIKFALSAFNEVCQKVLDRVELDNSGTELRTEAQTLKELLDDILLDSFFDDVSDLQMMPVNNQVLEKREGYSQIFKAFSMIDLALKLDWDGQDEVYRGEAQNTALLYEYWLFFELRNIMLELSGKTVDTSEAEKQKQFISDKNGLTVSLRQGVTSLQSFLFEDKKLKVNLYYNRTFSPLQFNSTVYWGSYSRPFRPDYSLAVFSSEYKNEKEAIKDGNVSYIHFDAKYRIQDLKQFAMPERHAEKNELVEDELQLTEEESVELKQEKDEENVNTYKRGDLLKMHTYNDAIRRTVGSYVLYPGSDTDHKESNQPSVYDEILPGVGAFAIRPSKEEGQKTNPGHEAVAQFINDILKFKENESSRQFRKDFFENMIIHSPAENKKQKQPESDNEYLMIGYIGTKYLRFLEENGFVPTNEDNVKQSNLKYFYYYFPAINNGNVFSIQKETTLAQYLRVTDTDVKNTIVENGYYFERLEPWEAMIESITLVSKTTLIESLAETGFKDTLKADFYYMVKARAIGFNTLGITGINFNCDKNTSMDSPKIMQRLHGEVCKRAQLNLFDN